MASSDKTIEYAVSVDSSGLKTGMEKAASVVKRAQGEIEGAFGGIGNAFSAVKGPLLAFTALLSGGKLFKDGIDSAVKLTGETVQLSKALGVSMQDASGLNVALRGIGSSAEVYSGSNAKLIKQVRTNESAVRAMGVATRDANGHYLDGKQLMTNALVALKNYKEGTDRNLAAQTLFGKGAAEVTPLLKLNNDVMDSAAKKASALGLVIGPEQAAATKAYKESLNDVKLVIDGFMNTVGQTLMPIFTDVAQWFSSVAPGAMGIFRSVFGTLGDIVQSVISVFKDLWDCVSDVFESIKSIFATVIGEDVAQQVDVWQMLMSLISGSATFMGGIVTGVIETIRGAVLLLIEIFKMYAAVVKAAFMLDWDGVVAACITGTDNIAKVINDSQDRIVSKTEKNFEKLEKIMGGKSSAKADYTPAATSGTKSYIAPKKAKKEKAEKEDGLVPFWESELARLKVVYMQEHDLYSMSLEDERQYWADKLATLNADSKEYDAVRKKVFGLEVADLKRKGQQKRALEIEELEFSRSTALMAVDLDQQAAGQRFELGQITDKQMIAEELAFEQRRYEINRQAIFDRIELMQKDPERNVVELQRLNNEKIKLEQAYLKARQALYNKDMVETLKPMLSVYQTMEDSFSNSLTDMLTKAKSWRSAMRGVFHDIYTSFINEYISKKIAQTAMSYLKETALGKTFQAATQAIFGQMTAAQQVSCATQVATQAAASTATVGKKAAEATGVVDANAAEAASGAAASVSSIPFIGWMMAAGVFASTMAMVKGAMSSVPSAAGGFDIPAGVNPMTQLHEQEMVLPAEHANVIRNMAANGGGSGGMTVHIHAMDGNSVQRLFERNGTALSKSLRKQARNFVK